MKSPGNNGFVPRKHTHHNPCTVIIAIVIFSTQRPNSLGVGLGLECKRLKLNPKLRTGSFLQVFLPVGPTLGRAHRLRGRHKNTHRRRHHYHQCHHHQCHRIIITITAITVTSVTHGAVVILGEILGNFLGLFFVRLAT